MERKQAEYNALVGVTESGELVMLQYVFDYGIEAWGSKRFKGAVGSSFMPLYQDYVDEQNTDESIMEFYGEFCPHTEPESWDYEYELESGDGVEFDEEGYNRAVEEYNELVASWVNEIRNEASGLFPSHDDSYLHLIDEDDIEAIYPGAVSLECIGGGRMFPLGYGGKWAKVFRPDLMTIIQNAEHVCRVYGEFPADLMEPVT